VGQSHPLAIDRRQPTRHIIEDASNMVTGDCLFRSSPSAGLVLAEWLGLSSRHLLEAFVGGGETGCRIGLGVSPGHNARGWHITSTCGVFGAAVACAKLPGLDAEPTTHAPGTAALLAEAGQQAPPLKVRPAGHAPAATRRTSQRRPACRISARHHHDGRTLSSEVTEAHNGSPGIDNARAIDAIRAPLPVSVWPDRPSDQAALDFDICAAMASINPGDRQS
jgi:hypothetical protein